MLTFADVSIKHLLKKYGLKVSDLADMYEFKNEVSMRNSSAYGRYVRGSEKLIRAIERGIIEKLRD